jgi:hypothetical protein
MRDKAFQPTPPGVGINTSERITSDLRRVIGEAESNTSQGQQLRYDLRRYAMSFSSITSSSTGRISLENWK